MSSKPLFVPEGYLGDLGAVLFPLRNSLQVTLQAACRSPYTFAYRHAYGSQADGHKSLDNSAKETLQEFGLQFWLSTNSESRSEYWGFARRRSLSAIPRVAPRTPWISQSCSENGLFTFHFSKIGVAPRFLTNAVVLIARSVAEERKEGQKSARTREP